MSFILDALKKSEIERQRQTVPGLMDTRLAARQNRLPVWAIVLGLLLGINIVVLVIMLLRNGTHTAAPAAPVKHPVAAAPATVEHFSPLDPAPVYAPEIPLSAPAQSASDPHLRAEEQLRGGPQVVAPLVVAPLAPPLHASRNPRRSEPLLVEQDAASDNDEVLPSINQISLTGAQALPELHLDVHVYATKPAERFVYINMRKYHEGATLQEGPTLERIRRDGVVLDFQGLRFILPRQ